MYFCSLLLGGSLARQVKANFVRWVGYSKTGFQVLFPAAPCPSPFSPFLGGAAVVDGGNVCACRAN